MKKRQILALGVVAAMAISCGNQGGKISTDVALNSDADTLAYAFGYDRGQGLENYLYQAGVLVDTMQFSFQYQQMIQEAESQDRKDALTKQLKTSIDSLQKANKKNMDDFYAGLQSGYNVDKSKAAYMRGQDIGSQLKMMADQLEKTVYGENSNEKLNKDAFLAGIATVVDKKEPRVTNPTVVFQTKMRKVEEDNLRKQHADVVEKNEQFLTENAKKDGVVTLPSGLQYEVIKEGNGVKPEGNDKVTVNYHGTLIDGTVFDSSVERGEPAEFGIRQVIPGWTEALQMMPVGSKWKVYIPWQLGYGARGFNKIGPFATLIFEVELLDVEKPGAAKK